MGTQTTHFLLMTSACNGLLSPQKSSFLCGDSSEVVRLTDLNFRSSFTEKLYLNGTKNRMLFCISNSLPFKPENVRFYGDLHFRYYAEGEFPGRRRVQASALEEAERPSSGMSRITHSSEDEISSEENWNRGRGNEPRGPWLLENSETRLSRSHLPRNRQSRLQNKFPVFRTVDEPERSPLQFDSQFENVFLSQNHAHGEKEDYTRVQRLQSVGSFSAGENNESDEKSPAFSSNLEEIIHKFKRKYGSENNRNERDKSFTETGKDYSSRAFLAPGKVSSSVQKTHSIMDVNSKSSSMGSRDKNANANDGRPKLSNALDDDNGVLMLSRTSDKGQERSFQVRKSSVLSRNGRKDKCDNDNGSVQSSNHYGRLPPMRSEAGRLQSKKKGGTVNSMPGPRIIKNQIWTQKFNNSQYVVSKYDGAVIQDTSDLENNFVDMKSSNLTENGSVSLNDRESNCSSSVDASEAVENRTSDHVHSSKEASWHKHNIPDLPFEFQYSYSETPNVPIVRYRETPFSPFGPPTMERPWTGRAPLKPSKKKLPEFDSFSPPPKGKKGIKFVQDPGPYSEGEGPKSSNSREEIMGDPLTPEEIAELVLQCQRDNRQLNLGRDGLTHNMLDLIHCHWKRRRVCKIRCIGVPTVDMDNLCFHIEDKSGGKIIYRTGGVVYLFRGRNYNYKDRPKIPLMLWKPVTPVYPKLIQPAPGGLSEEEADRLRDLGAKVEPLCKLVKNGVYLTLVDDVKAAFEVDELVCIDCEGLNPSDYKKIGAKLRDLVPCVLLSFDKERILMWKGKPNVSSDFSNETVQDEVSTSEDSNASTIYEVMTTLIQDGAGSPPGKEDQGETCVYLELDSPKQDKGEAHECLELHSEVKHSADKAKEESIHKEMYSNTIFRHINNLWDKALESGMAVQLDEYDISSDFVAKKAHEVAESAPIGPKYSEWLIKHLRVNREERKAPDPIQTNLGRLTTAIKRKKTRKLLQKTEVPQSRGLPLEDLTRFLSTK